MTGLVDGRTIYTVSARKADAVAIHPKVGPVAAVLHGRELIKDGWTGVHIVDPGGKHHQPEDFDALANTTN